MFTLWLMGKELFGHWNQAEPSSSANTSSELKQNWFLFYIISIFTSL